MVEKDLLVNSVALEESKILAAEILTDIELGRVPLSQSILKASRLARLLGDFDCQKMFLYESGGYPSGPGGIEFDVFELGRKAGRVKSVKQKDGTFNETMSKISVEAIEEHILTARAQLSVAGDANYSVSSANPSQIVGLSASNNRRERDSLTRSIREFAGLLSQSKRVVYEFVLEKNLALTYSKIVGSAFDRVRTKVDADIGEIAPKALEKFNAVYKNLNSESEEDWSNAVHSCRRILQDLADQVFPPQKDAQERNGKTIKVGKDQYINRLMCFAEDRASSERFTDIVGSHMGYLGDRLDAIFRAAQKGSHDTITSREEADRYVVYTYMVVSDILGLVDSHK